MLSFLGFPLHNDLCIWEWFLCMFCDAPDRTKECMNTVLWQTTPALLTRKTETSTHRFTLIYIFGFSISVLSWKAEVWLLHPFPPGNHQHSALLIPLLSGVTVWAEQSRAEHHPPHSERGFQEQVAQKQNMIQGCLCNNKRSGLLSEKQCSVNTWIWVFLLVSNYV